MRMMLRILPILAVVACGALVASAQTTPYVPAAVYCYQPIHGPVSASPLCATLPGNIGADPALTTPRFGYKGIAASYPTNFAGDV